MPEEASVSLNAIDNTTPAATAAMNSLNAYGETVERSVVPHRAAHQAMALVTGELAALAGATHTGEAALRVFDSILFQVAITGGAVSIEFIAITAALVALTSIVTQHAKDQKDLNDEYDRTMAALDALIPSQNKAANATLDEAKAMLIKLEAQKTVMEQTPTMISRVEASIKSGASTVESFIGGIAKNFLLGEGLVEQAADVMSKKIVTAMTETNPAIDEVNKKIDAMKERLNAAAVAVDPVKKQLQELATDFALLGQEFTNKAAQEIEAAARKDQDALQKFGQEANATQGQLDAFAKKIESSSMSYEDFINKTKQTSNVVITAMKDMSSQVGEVIGEMIAGADVSWQQFMGKLLSTLISAMQQVVAIWMAASTMISLGLGPLSIPAGLALEAVLGIAQGIVGTMFNSVPAPSSSTSSSNGGSSVTTASTAAASAAGGQPVSSAQTSMINNFTINVPVQALDLSAISDTTMRALAYKIGRMIQDAASTGQLSLAGGS